MGAFEIYLADYLLNYYFEQSFVHPTLYRLKMICLLICKLQQLTIKHMEVLEISIQNVTQIIETANILPLSRRND